jgi:hypothetical protein
MIATYSFLVKDGKLDMVYQLLNRLLEWVNQFSFKEYLISFYASTNRFWEISKGIFDLNVLTLHIHKDSTKKTGYFIIYLLKSACLIETLKDRIQLLKRISLSIPHVNRFIRPFILQEYFGIQSAFPSLPLRKKRFLMK